MSKKLVITLLALVFVLVSLVACNSSNTTSFAANEVVNTNVSNTTTISTTSTDSAAAVSVPDAAAENSASHEDAADYILDDTQTTSIILKGTTIATDDSAVTISGSTATITTAGTYTLSGTLSDGQIIVNTEDEATVKLVLNGVDIHSSSSAPLYIANAAETVIVLADNSVNTISDSDSYVFTSADEDEPNAALFSKGDLTIYGSGSLTVTGNYNDGIASKDGLIIASGTITVNAVDDGIRGKDYLVVKDGTITVTAQGDGLKSDNEEDTTKGYITIENGTFQIISGGDAIQAQTDVLISAGDFILTAGGGSNGVIAADASAKGIKAVVNVNLDNGTFTVNTADDALHSNANLVINGGTFNLMTGDDGVHADAMLTINDGDIQITESYEGIESAVITINGGEIDLVASDDGLNVAGGNDGSGMMAGPGRGGRQGQGGNPGGESFAAATNQFLTINGGTIKVHAAGDGIDVNGSVTMTGGLVIVNGPTEQMNGALDYDGSFNISGGFLVAAGSAGMAQAPGNSSSQYSLLINFNSTLPAGTLIHIQNSDGENILTFAPDKSFQSVTFSSATLSHGETYELYYGGSSSGSANAGLYQDGTYTPGSLYTSFTISGVVTGIGSSPRR